MEEDIYKFNFTKSDLDELVLLLGHATKSIASELSTLEVDDEEFIEAEEHIGNSLKLCDKIVELLVAR